MALGNFLRGVAAHVLPGGGTYGSYNPPQKKKLQPGDPGYVAPVPVRSVPQQPAQQANQPPLHVQSPQDLFAGLNNSLKLPGAPQTNISVQRNPNNLPTTPPQPGTIIRPTSAPITASKPSFLSQIRGGLKTAAQTALGTVANVPEVGLAAAGVGTGIVEGATQLPHIATAIEATGTKKLDQIAPNSLTHALNTVAQSANTGVKKVTNVVDTPFGVVNSGLDAASRGYAGHVPGATAGTQVYKNAQIPLNVLAGLLSLGGASVAEGGGEAGNLGKVASFLNKSRSSNSDNVISKLGQTINNRVSPVAQAVNNPIGAVKAGIAKLANSRAVIPAERGAIDAGEAGNLLTDAQVNDINTINIPVGRSITVTHSPSEPVNVPVANRTPLGQPIREFPGDTPGVVKLPTPDEIANQRASDNFNAQPVSRPDPAVGGVVPGVSRQPFALTPEITATGQAKIIKDYADMLRSLGEGNGTQLVPDGTGGYTRTSNNLRTGVNAGKRMSKQDWLNQAETELRSGKAESSTQKAFNDAADPEVQALLNKGEQPAAPVGRPITVKQATSVPVIDKTAVAPGLPKAPDAVRAIATNTISPPKATQDVLDNPKQFNRRQVAAVRNQRKMANQVAKAKEDTATAADRIETVSPAAQSGEGHVATGEYAKGRNGNYEKVHQASEATQGDREVANMSPGDVIKTARKNAVENGSYTDRDMRNINALLKAKRITKDMPEYSQIKTILAEDGTHTAQKLAIRGGIKFRRTATPDQLTSQFESKIYRLADDPTKIDSKAFDDVESAHSKFTDARDAATEAHNRFTESPTSANAKAYHVAQDATDQADKDAKMTEFKVAQKVLKGNKDTKQVREIQKLAKEADLYQMDGVDASMLSGTGTFARNFVNSAVGGAEEGLFGGLGSRIASKFTHGESIGGGFGRDTLSGFGKGTKNIVDASKARASNAGKNPLEHLKNWSTTGNQLGDSVIDSQVNHNLIDHYTQDLKSQGYKGRELTDRAGVMAREDPKDVGRVYAGYARAAAGLGSGITKGSKIESTIKNGISDALSGNNPNKASELTAKLLTRMTVGFPSAVGRTIVEGSKRASFGAPTALRAMLSKSARDDPAVRAQLIKESVKQFGTGATAGAIFYKLGQDGSVTGSYPTDPEERARWQREGITENSIKIGSNYYQLPSYLGSAALPALFAATLGRNNGDVAKSAGEVAKGLPSILPTDQASNVLDWINGKTNSGKFLTQTGASAVRALTPAGALLNQVAKSFDSTQNDTTTGSALNQFMDKIISGIPGENKFASIPDKTDDEGNAIHNPGALPLAFGASTTTQGKGVQETKDINDQTNGTLKAINSVGGLNDPNIKAVLDKDSLKIYNEALAGKQVSPDDLKKLQTAMVRGVSGTGDDTAYLEKGQYASNLTALNLKRNEMAADPTTKPSDLAKMDLAIKRGQVYKSQNIPYDQISDYEGTSLSDWRAMGDPESDSYDPDQYQALWDIDQAMTKAGASYAKGDSAKNKYSAKAASSGRGGSKEYSADFGKLKAGVGAPTVQSYQTIDQQSGGIPTIKVVRPNIVHKISSS